MASSGLRWGAANIGTKLAAPSRGGAERQGYIFTRNTSTTTDKTATKTEAQKQADDAKCAQCDYEAERLCQRCTEDIIDMLYWV